MIDRDRLAAWIRNVKATTDVVERVNADPMQHLSEEQVTRMIEDLENELIDIAGLTEKRKALEGKR